MASWLDDFVEFSSYGESTPKVLFWVGVATIAGALRRKVWIDQTYFQWTPNFYLLIVGPPGQIKKSTSIDMGLKFLKRVPGIDFGAQSTTWQQLITHMAASHQAYLINGEVFEASCVTISISEFGTFFDPNNRELVDNLTDLWDSKLGTFKKETKTNGCDEIINPWINIMACTTPAWLTNNFGAGLVGTGFASRPIFLYEPESTKDVAYPKLEIPTCTQMFEMEMSLTARLNDIADLSGEFIMTKGAYEWGKKWYSDYRMALRSMGSQTEAGFYERKQTHLHKLAMVLSASKGEFPSITVEHLIEADRRLSELEPDVRQIFGFVGQTRLSQTSAGIVEILDKFGAIRKKELYRRYFFRTMSNEEFESALRSVQACGLIGLQGPLDDLIVIKKD